jgi:hypothetical protein
MDVLRSAPRVVGREPRADSAYLVSCDVGSSRFEEPVSFDRENSENAGLELAWPC